MKPEYDIFLVRDEQGPILYAPLNDLTARINEAAVASVSRFIQNEKILPEDESVLESLRTHGFFDPTSLPSEQQNNKPVEVTLFPTDGCNMRCSYCYAKAEHATCLLPITIGKAAIDRVAKNATELETDDFVVGFHGNGEPMTAFPIIKELCEYAYNVGEQCGKTPKFTIATNGVLDEEKLDFLIDNFVGVNISFDGLPDIQNMQRPLANGTRSFPLVDATIRTLDAAGVHYGIRSTLTASSVSRLEEIASFVISNYPHCSHLHIEPAWECGRCLQTDEKTPDTHEFIEHFKAAYDICENTPTELVFSAVRTGIVTDSFCGVCKDSFTVTQEGLVTSCFEVSGYEDPRSETFIYGQFETSSSQFIFDDTKRERLHQMTVDNMPYCSDCFCKYHCGGDCVAKVLETGIPADHRGSQRCEITRALSLDVLKRRLKQAEQASRKGEKSCLKTTA